MSEHLGVGGSPHPPRIPTVLEVPGSIFQRVRSVVGVIFAACYHVVTPIPGFLFRATVSLLNLGNVPSRVSEASKVLGESAESALPPRKPPDESLEIPTALPITEPPDGRPDRASADQYYSHLIEDRHKQWVEKNNTQEWLINYLFLASGSSLARSGELAKLGNRDFGSTSEQQFIELYTSLETFRSTVIGAEREVIDKVLEELHEARPFYLLAGFEIIQRGLLKTQLQNMKTGESRIINAEFRGHHATTLECICESDGTFTLLLFNTGFGVNKYHDKTVDGKYYPFTITGVRRNQLNEKFCAHFFNGKSENLDTFMQEFYRALAGLKPSYAMSEAIRDLESAIRPSESLFLEPEKTKASLLDFLQQPANALLRLKLRDYYLKDADLPADIKEALNTPLPASLESRYQPYKDQGPIGNCAYKALSTLIHRALGSHLYQKFKANNLETHLQKLESLRAASPDTPPQIEVAAEAQSVKAPSNLEGLPPQMSPEWINQLIKAARKEIKSPEEKLITSSLQTSPASSKVKAIRNKLIALIKVDEASVELSKKFEDLGLTETALKVLIGAPEYPEKGAKINQLRIQLISKLLSQERVADAELVVRQIAPLYRDKLIIVCCKKFFEKKDFAHLLEWANQIEASAKKDELFEECSRDCLEKEEYSSAIEWAHKIRDPSYRDEMMEGVVEQICFFKNKEEARAVTKEITDPERREKAIKEIDDYEPDD